jgi:hypothetical protein
VPRAFEARAFEVRALEARAFEARAFEARALEARASEARAFEALSSKKRKMVTEKVLHCILSLSSYVFLNLLPSYPLTPLHSYPRGL